MTQICKAPLQNWYLDQIDERNKEEKGQYSDIFEEYMELLTENKEMQDKVKQLEKENEQLRSGMSSPLSIEPSSGNSVSRSFGPGASSFHSTKEQTKYEGKIKDLGEQLKESKQKQLEHAGKLLESTEENNKLKSENSAL